MKKAITLLLAAVMALSLAACGGQKATSEEITVSSTESFERYFEITFSLSDYKKVDDYNATVTINISARPKTSEIAETIDPDSVSLKVKPTIGDLWSVSGNNEIKLTHQDGLKYTGKITVSYNNTYLPVWQIEPVTSDDVVKGYSVNGNWIMDITK